MTLSQSAPPDSDASVVDPPPPPPPPPSTVRDIAYLSSPPSKTVFRSEYLLPLVPLIFSDDPLQDTWPCYELWTTRQAPGRLEPNVRAIADAFREAGRVAAVAFDDVAAGYGEERREDMSFDQFGELWNSLNEDFDHDEGNEVQTESKPYLKDFHLCLARPDLNMYTVYDFFQDDWMNAHALHCTADDYRFLYLGADGTRTSFHHDVYLSHSWSTSLTGIKLWTLLAPHHAQLLKHRQTGDLLPGSDIDAPVSEQEYPGIKEARNVCKRVWQYPGETIFVPSGWVHSVVNFGSALSINHNWGNISCLRGMHAALAEQTSRAGDLLADLPPAERWPLVYDQVVKPSWGWSFVELWDVIDWALKNPQGGPNWRAELDPKGKARTIARELATQWLAREEAEFMTELRIRLEGILSTLDDPSST